MYCRTHTTPRIYYASKSIVGGQYILTFAAPVMVYVEHQCTCVDKLETVFDAPLVFVVFDRNAISRLRRKSVVDGMFNTGWTLPA
jgi:hypothetical protein